MRARLAAPAIFLSLILAATSLGGGAVARAQSDVDRARQEADQARQDADRARSLVDERVADRDAVESRLIDTLTRYEETAIALADAGDDLSRITDQLSVADATALGLESALGEQIVTAYVEAVAASGVMVWSSNSVEEVLVVGTTLETGSADTNRSLDQLATYRRELESLREQLAAETDRYRELEAQLEAQSAELQDLFSQADSAVADAFTRAREAEAAYEAALDDVARAQAIEEDRRRREEEAQRRAAAAAATSTTQPPRSTTTTTTSGTSSTSGSSGTTAPPSPTTTTTTTPPPPPPPSTPGSFKPAVERWRSTVAAHFPASRVDEALTIIQCESGGDPRAYNPYSGASGLFQFLPGTWAASATKAGVGDRSVFDGEANIIAAAWLASYYESRGYDFWRPWSCRRYL